MENFDILDTIVSSCTRDQLISKAELALSQKKKSYHFLSINPIKIIRSHNDSELKSYIDKADIVYPDAIGVCVAMSLLYGINQERIPGYEFHFDVLELCEKYGYGIYIIGSKQKVLMSSIKKYQNKYPRIKLVGFNDGYFDEKYFFKKILKNISQKKPELVLVAMGAKLQEKYIEIIRSNVNVPLLMGIGGSLDAFVGNSPRAPEWMLKIGLEWFFRLLMQPWRYKAMLPLPIFAYKILKRKIFGR